MFSGEVVGPGSDVGAGEAAGWAGAAPIRSAATISRQRTSDTTIAGMVDHGPTDLVAGDPGSWRVGGGLIAQQLALITPILPHI
jgi:hypothetical protein